MQRVKRLLSRCRFWKRRGAPDAPSTLPDAEVERWQALLEAYSQELLEGRRCGVTHAQALAQMERLIDPCDQPAMRGLLLCLYALPLEPP